MIPPVFDESEFPERLRHLVALEIDRIVEDLDSRRDFLLEIWSRHRDREPFLETVFSRWRTLNLNDIAVLPVKTIEVVEAFYRELDELRLYFRYTQDMPTTLQDRYDESLHRIAVYGAMAVDALGGAPRRPVVEFADEVEHHTLLRDALSSPPPPRHALPGEE